MKASVEAKVMQRLQAAGGLEVRPGHGADLIVSGRGLETVLSLEVKPRLADETIAEIEQMPRDRRERTVLVVPALSPKRRQQLRSRDISWIEYQTGAVHLRVPHLVMDLPGGSPPKGEGPKGLPALSGKAGVIVEALIELGQRQELVSQPEIADLSGSTQAWTSKIFGKLVRVGALEVVGRGPAKDWRPNLDELFRLWIADQGHEPTATGMYLWARAPTDLIRAVGQIGAEGLSYAIGGVAAANLHQPALTALPAVNVWIPLSSPPEIVASRLRADLVDSGANVTLWQATGDPALRLAGPLHRWRRDAPEALHELSVVTPARAALEAFRASGRGPEVGENLRRRIVEHAWTPSDDE